MTFRLLGLPEELRLALEETSGIDTEAARLIVELSVREAEDLARQQIANATREIQSIVGPHGALSRVQAGGLRITPGSGMGVFLDGVYKTQIQPNGTFIIGSNIENPETTTEVFFTEDTVYNNEEFGAGDYLIGDNSTGQSNMKWDASEGQLQFRGGTTVQVYMDTDGSIKAGGGDVTIDQWGITFANQQGAVSFDDTNGDPNNLIIYSDSADYLVLKNSFGGKGIRFDIDDASHNVKIIQFQDNGIVLDPGMTIYLNGGSDDISAGWIPKTETWTRTGNHTFTVSGDLTARYRKGTKVRYSDGGTDYGVIASSSYSAPNTTVTLITNTDYTMAAATITDTYLSYIDNPEGFPAKFNFTSTVTYANGTTDPTSVTVNSAYWSMIGGSPFVTIKATLVRGSGNRQFTIFSVPFTMSAFNIPISGTDNITAAGFKQPTACYGHTNDIYFFETMANDGTYEINGVLRLA
jgi:hypothetical protein